MALKHNTPDLANKIPGPGGQDVVKRVFNASLVIVDGKGTPRPYLAETLPELGTDTWKVLPDGTMETTYRLRPNLTWHDGKPLTAEDFAFAWQVYVDPALGTFDTNPEQLMESVTAPDPRTVLIRWRVPFPDADALDGEKLDPLPRHILGELYEGVKADPASADGFINNRFWNSDYVGAGPFRLARWEPSVEWEGAAFEGHALGRPKLDRIIVKLIPDLNTVLANILAGEVHFAPDNTLQFEHGQMLMGEWAASKKGVVLFKKDVPIVMEVQQRPDAVGNPALLDVRVRRAIAHSIDRNVINEGLFEGRGFPTEHMVPSDSPIFAKVDAAVMKYPYDPRKTQELMNEAGLTKNGQGWFADASGRELKLELRYSQSPEWERRTAIMADVFRKSGILADPYPLPVEAGRSRETRGTFPMLASRGGGPQEMNFTTEQIAAPENRWGGRNRSGWSNAEYDALYDAFLSTLNRTERIEHFTSMSRLLSEYIPVYMLHFYMRVNAWDPNLVGPEAQTPPIGSLTRNTPQHWNLQEWYWKS
jgi:peptide/nickel transport system substrate-binding protein